MHTPPPWCWVQAFSSASAGFHWSARNQVGKAPWAFDPRGTLHPDFVRRGQQVRLVPAGEESVVMSMQENDLGRPPPLVGLGSSGREGEGECARCAGQRWEERKGGREQSPTDGGK